VNKVSINPIIESKIRLISHATTPHPIRDSIFISNRELLPVAVQNLDSGCEMIMKMVIAMTERFLLLL
jgi:hypothetical protein